METATITDPPITPVLAPIAHPTTTLETIPRTCTQTGISRATRSQVVEPPTAIKHQILLGGDQTDPQMAVTHLGEEEPAPTDQRTEITVVVTLTLTR